MSALAQAILNGRRERGWTQTDLAARLEVSQSTVSFWENAVEVPSLEHKMRLVELMPEVLAALTDDVLGLFDRIQALERAVFNGKCACANCNCTPETEAKPLSEGSA
jgi:transcriptional regulator with XRE-family HTH domain